MRASSPMTFRMLGITFDLESRPWRLSCVVFPLVYSSFVLRARGPALGAASLVLVGPALWWMAAAPHPSRTFWQAHPTFEALWGAAAFGFLGIAALLGELPLWICAALTVPYAAILLTGARRRGHTKLRRDPAS